MQKTLTLPKRLAIRSATRADLDALVEIDCDSFANSWEAREFKLAMGDHEVRLVVAVIDEELAGYVLWWLPIKGRQRYEAGLLRLAVAPSRRRRGVGAALLRERLRHLRSDGLRNIARCTIKADDLAAQLFLRAVGWMAEGSVMDDDEEWIMFVFHAGWPLPGER